MIEELCAGKLQSKNITIKDDAACPGRHLLQAFLAGFCSRFDQVLLIASERPPCFYTQCLPLELRDKVMEAKNPLQLEDISGVPPLAGLVSSLCSGLRGSDARVGVVIDSVTPFVCTRSAVAAPRLVQALLAFRERGVKVEQVVSVVHSDVHNTSELPLILGRPSTLITLQPPSSPRHRYSCVVTHGERGRPSLNTKIEDFNISDDFLHLVDVTTVTKTKTEEAKSQVILLDKAADPTADLTFNLSLKPEERAAKDQVVLPYTQMSSESQGGQIHYIPDDADDFDDEDPDEDLDF